MITQHRDGDVAVIEIDRHERRNALDAAHCRDLSEAVNGPAIGAGAQLALACAALAWARELAGLAPLSLACTKKALNQGTRHEPDGAELARDFEACWASEDAAEGQRARADGRPPGFRGR